MSRQTVIGAISDTVGGAARWENYRDESRGVLLGRRQVVWSCPSDRFRPTQPADLPLQLGHFGERIGTVLHLENRGRLWVVAETNPGVDLSRQPWKLSYDVIERRGLLDLEAVAVVTRSHTVCMPDIEVRHGSLAVCAAQVVSQDGLAYELVKHAAEDTARRRRGPIEIRGATAAVIEPAAPSGPVEYRSAQLANVDHVDRTIELVVMPYETGTTIVRRDGSTFTEIVSRGAFDGAEHETRRITVNRGHAIDRVVGKTTALYPNHPEGLVAEVRISRTELGNETLILAEDGILSASAGFRVKPNGESWPSPRIRRLNHLDLHHIAMTPDPAYEDARVLAVRSEPTSLISDG
jgi:HK97 family phage prohead protease